MVQASPLSTLAVTGVTSRKVDSPLPVNEATVLEESVTKALASFVAHTSHSDTTPEISIKLKSLLLDYLGVSSAAGYGAESTPKILAGVEAFKGSARGDCTVITHGSSFPPQYAALINGALCHSYDFDDTQAAAILHPGSSLVSAALAEAESQNASGSDLLLALAVGYEVACRLGTALSNGSYKRGFHNTGTAGIFGSVAAVSKLRNCTQQQVEDAFGLALSKAAGSMQFLENGSWNKRLHPGFAAHDAMLCVALAQAGVIGASQPIEGKYGLLHNFSEKTDPAGLTYNLGHTWTFLDTACKPFPACRMTHGQLEMAGRLRKRHADKGLPVHIHTFLPPGNYPIIGLDSPNKIRPQTIVDAQFSSYFQTAAAWILGNTLGWSIYDHIHDEDVCDLACRISIDIDPTYTNLESRMVVTFADGSVVEDEVVHPLAEPERPFEWNTGVQKKFLGLAVPVFGPEVAQRICRAVEDVENIAIVDLMRLVA